MENINSVLASVRQRQQKLEREKQIEAKVLQLAKTDAMLASFLNDAMRRAVNAEQRAAELERHAAELADRREQGAEVESLRQQLEQERAARLADADAIKTLQAALEKESREVKELTAIVREQAEVIRRVNTVLPAAVQGLTFPYVTKELKAMRAAVAKYWESYTPDKRQPTQKEISLWIGESLGLQRQASGDAARAAIVMAGAIKRPADT